MICLFAGLLANPDMPLSPRANAGILATLTSESASCRLVWQVALKVEEGHPSRTVEDHCPQTHLSIDEGLDEDWVV